MALTNHDLMAISQLMDQKIQPLHHRLDLMDNRLDNMDSRLDKLESNVSALKAGQIDLRKSLNGVDRKVSETYKLALDAWGTSAENRVWLENNTLKA